MPVRAISTSRHFGNIGSIGISRTKDEILHSGQSQFTDLVGGKPLGLTIAWINRRQIALDASVPRPDFILPDIQSLTQIVHV
jgi:2-haloacid dehalogenase